MSEWSKSDLLHLEDLESTIKESLREYVGDGEGLDVEVLTRYRESVRRDALNEAEREIRAMFLAASEDADHYLGGHLVVEALDDAVDLVRSLASPANEGADDAETK